MENEKKKVPIEGYLSFIILAIIALTLGAEIIARFFFQSSIRWASELARYLFIWFIFLGASYAVVEKTHVKIDGFSRLIFPEKIRPYMELLGNFVWIIFSFFVTYIGLKYSFDVYKQGSVSAALRVPLAFIYFAIPIGYLLMALRLSVQSWKELKSLLNKT